MPQIARQKMTDNGQQVRRTLRTDSILSRAVPVTSLDASAFMQLLLWGKNRIGKTRLACEFPKPLLLICCDPKNNGGADTVRRIGGITVLRQGIELSGSADVERVGVELRQGCLYKSVVVDGLQSLEDILLAEVCGWEQTANMLKFGKVTMDQYVERSERMRMCLRPFVDLKGCHVIYTATEKDHNPPEGRKAALVRSPQAESLFGPAVGSGACRWLHDSVNWTCQLFFDKETRRVKNVIGVGKNRIETEDDVETGRIVRRLRLRLHTNFLAGVNAPGDDDSGVPEFIDGDKPKDFFDKIMAVFNGLKD